MNKIKIGTPMAWLWLSCERVGQGRRWLCSCRQSKCEGQGVGVCPVESIGPCPWSFRPRNPAICR